MFRNETLLIVFTLLLVSMPGYSQKTWWGEYSFYGGGGDNEIFRFEELLGAGSVTGTGVWTAGADLRRLAGKRFSFGTGLSYSHQYYYTSPAPGIPGEDRPGSFGMITVPVTARVDCLKWLFADAGVLFGFQAGLSDIDNMSGLGVTVGAGIQYNFKSDLFVRVRAYASQYGLVHLMPDDYPRTMTNAGVTAGVGYRFIRLGKCNCPDDDRPRR
jgi:opacity protein-like surface antigen